MTVNGNGLDLIFSQLAGNNTRHSVDDVEIRNFRYDGRAAKTLGYLNATTN